MSVVHALMRVSIEVGSSPQALARGGFGKPAYGATRPACHFKTEPSCGVTPPFPLPHSRRSLP
jgi:hypothetical protein